MIFVSIYLPLHLSKTGTAKSVRQTLNNEKRNSSKELPYCGVQGYE